MLPEQDSSPSQSLPLNVWNWTDIPDVYREHAPDRPGGVCLCLFYPPMSAVVASIPLAAMKGLLGPALGAGMSSLEGRSVELDFETVKLDAETLVFIYEV